MSDYVDVVDVAKQVRANIKAAQKTGQIDPDVTVRVRVGRASMCQEVNVFIQGTKLTDGFLMRPEQERREHGWATAAAVKLANQVRACMGPAEAWADGRMNFSCLYFRNGLCAP